MPDDVLEDTLWAHLNLEDMRITQDNAYDVVTEEITSILSYKSEEDLNKIGNLKKMYAQEIKEFKKGPLSLIPDDSKEYNVKLSNFIQSIRSDNETKLNAYFRYLGAQRGKVPLIILDNVDKRNSNEQLKMFKVSKWIKKNFRCIVVLPIREETYNNYKDEPPLDTAIKDLTFRIDPPSFGDVLSERIDLIVDEVEDWGEENIELETSDGTTITYDPPQQADFLRSIKNSLLENNEAAEHLISGVSGMNLRRAMEMFLDFCKSGYLPEDHIARMGLSGGDLTAPKEVTTRALIRGSDRFYDEDTSLVKNLYSTRNPSTERSHFLRIFALKWLDDRKEQKGPAKVKGYFHAYECINYLYRLGFNREDSIREIDYLIEGKLITPEHLEGELKSSKDLICISPVGVTHLGILDNSQYLGAVCEDCAIFENQISRMISRRMAESAISLENEREIINARDFIDYIKLQISNFRENLSRYSKPQNIPSIPEVRQGHSKLRNIIQAMEEGSWRIFTRNYDEGDIIYGKFMESKNDKFLFGVFRNVTAVCRQENISDDSPNFREGDLAKLKIFNFRPQNHQVEANIE